MNGRILGIKIGDTFVPCEMSCDISIDGERINTSSSENGNWRNSIAGYRSWKASVNGKFQLDASEGSEAGSLGLIQAIIDGINVELVMTLRIDSTQSLLIGGIAGTTNISISAGSTGEATWSGAFDGVGLLDLDYSFGSGFLRDNDGDKIVDDDGFGVMLAEGDVNFPNGVSQVSPAGTKILVADTNDDIAFIVPMDMPVSTPMQTALNGKLSNITGLIQEGTNVTISGSGTSGSPYVINSSGGGGGGSGTVTSVGMTSTDFDVSGSPITTSGTLVANIKSGAVTFAKMQSVAQGSLVGRGASGTGVLSVVTIGSGLTLSTGNVLSASGGGGGSGTVTSVAMTVPTGLSISGSPITASGTLALSLASGYSIPTTTKQSSWDAKQDALTAGTNITIVGNTISATGGGSTILSGSAIVPIGHTIEIIVATVTGAAVGDTVVLNDYNIAFDIGGTDYLCILTAEVSSANTVSIYISPLVPASATPVPVKTLPLTLLFKVIK